MMKKKWLAIVLSVVLILTISGCGEKDTEKNDNEVTQTDDGDVSEDDVSEDDVSEDDVSEDDVSEGSVGLEQAAKDARTKVNVKMIARSRIVFFCMFLCIVVHSLSLIIVVFLHIFLGLSIE